MVDKVLVSIVGPTGIGKTKVAIAVAKHFGAEIVSADSRQFYKEMNIGTAIPSQEELATVPHHFIQHKSIFDNYSVGDFEKEALLLLQKLFKHHDIIVMVGGSGLYIDAVTKGLDRFPEIDPEIRIELNKILEKDGIQTLQKILKELDRDYYDKVDLENPQRVIRALEVSMGSGKPYSSFLERKKIKRPFRIVTIGITADRETIYKRINQRVDLMVKKGLVDEARRLKRHSHLNAMQTVGYKELFNHFNGEWDLEFAISEIKKNTRRFAKRQLTWFKKNQSTIWTGHNTDVEEIVHLIEKKL